MHTAAVPEYPFVSLFSTEIQVSVLFHQSSQHLYPTHSVPCVFGPESPLILSATQTPVGPQPSILPLSSPTYMTAATLGGAYSCRLILQVRNLRHGGRRDFPNIPWLRNDRAMMSARCWLLTSSQRTGRNGSFQTLMSFSI